MSVMTKPTEHGETTFMHMYVPIVFFFLLTNAQEKLQKARLFYYNLT